MKPGFRSKWLLECRLADRNLQSGPYLSDRSLWTYLAAAFVHV